MQMLVSAIGNDSHNTKIGFAGVVDEACWAAHEFAVYFIWILSQAIVVRVLVVEFVEGEEVEIFGSCLSLSVLTAAFCFGRDEDLADVFVDELALFEIFSGTNT